MTTSQRFETACGRTLNEWATRWPLQGRVEPACGCTRRLRAARPETKILLTSGYSQEAVFQNEIVEPATTVGSSIANGVAAPVRPMLMSIDFKKAVFRSAGNLNAVAQRGNFDV